MPRIEEFDDVQLDVEFTQASSRSNLTSNENIAISLGKISKWYEALVPTGGSSGQFLAWNSSGTAKWVANPNTDTKVTSTLLAQSTAAATYLPTFVSAAGNSGVNIMNSFSFRHTPGTTSDVGNSRIVLGNATASGTANNEEGQIILYSSSTSYHTIKGSATASTVTHSLPTTGGTILNTGTTSFTRTLTSGTKVGSIKINGTSQDIYAPTNTNTTYTLTQDSTDGHKITLTPSSGTAQTITIPDNNTTYALSGAYGTSSNTWVTTLTPSSGTATTSTVPTASTSVYGITKLSSATNSTSTALAATPSAVKSAYDLANGKSTVSFSASLTTGTKVGTITIDGTGTDIYCETNTNTDTKVTDTVGTANTYYPAGGTSTSTATGTQVFDTSLKFIGTTGTTSAVGKAQLVLGNSTASSTANNKQGSIVLYGSTAYAHTIQGAPTAARTLTLPDKAGTFALTSDIPSVPTVNNAALTLKGAGTTVTTFTANASSAKSLDIVAGSNVIVTADATNAKISIASSHPTITKSTDTTSTASPAHGGTFTTVDSVTRDGNGHVTKINTKTITLPADSNTDTKVSQTLATADNNRPLLMSYYLTGETTTTAQVVHRNDSLYFNPSSGVLRSPRLYLQTTGMPITINLDTLQPTAGENVNVLAVQYKNTDGSATHTVYPIGILGNDATGSSATYNSGVRLGSTNGTTIVGAGESSVTFAAAQAKYNDETLYLVADQAVYMYTNCSNDATTVTGPWRVGGFTTGTSAITSGRVMITDGTTGGFKASDYTIAKSVPSDAKFSDTTYSAGTGLSLSGTAFNHSNSVTAVTSAVFKKITYDAQGHITGTANVAASDLPSHTHSQYLPKTTYEWNKEISFGNSGYLKIGSFPMYDTNITIDINSTTSKTYHGIVVIATQNVSTTSMGSSYKIHVYDDPTGNIAASLRIVWTSGSRNYDIYFVPQSWSKNFIHIRALGNYMDGATDICVSQTGTAPATTSGLEPVNILSVTSTGDGNAVTAISADANGALTVTKGSTFSLSTHTHSNYLPMSTVSSSTDADTLFTTSQWINWNTTTEVETTHMPTTNYGILLAKAYPGIQVFIPDTAAGIYFRKKTNASTAATAWWGITGTAGNTYNLNNFLPLSGGTLTGAVNFANNTMNKLGDDVQFGDGNVAGHMIVQGLNSTTGINLKYASNSYPNCNMTVTTKSLANTQFIGLYNYDASGTGIVLGGETGGLMVLGGGESPIGFHNIMTNASTNPLGVAWYDGTEKTLITSDNEIYFMSGAQSLGSSAHTDWTNCKTIVFDSSGNFNPTITNKGSVGTASKYWATSYITTMYGQHKRSEGGSWISARTNAAVWSNSDSSTGDAFYPATFSKTKSGGWAMGTLGNDDRLAFSYTTDANFSNNANTSTYTIYLPSESGTVALTNHTHNYAGSSSAGGAANSSDVLNSNTRMDYGWNGVNYFNISATAGNAAKVNDTPTTAWWHIMRFNHANNVGYYTDLAIPFNDISLYYKRIAQGSVQNGGWVKVLDALNIGYVMSSSVIKYDSHTRRFTSSKADDAWNAQAYSNTGYSDNVYVSFRPGQTTMYAMIGLDTNPSEDANYNKIDYCWYIKSNGALSVYESGTSVSIAGHTTYASGDEFRVEYSCGEIRYYHNGTMCRSVARDVSEKLFFDSSFYNAGNVYDFSYGTSTHSTHTAQIITSTYKSLTYVTSLTNSVITLSDAASSFSFGGWICGPTKNGRIAISSYQGYDDKLYFGYGERGRTANSYAKAMTWDGPTNTLTADKFVGALQGNVTGNCSGSSGSCTGTAANANKLNTDAGTTSIPVYFSGGLPVQCTTPNAYQTDTTTNADYRVLFSTNANDTTQSGTTRKNINLQYNPSTATLKIGDYVSGSTATKNGKLVLGNSSNVYTHTINTNADKLSNVSLTLNSTDGIMGTDTLCYKGYESANLASDTAPGTLADISSLSNAVSFSGYLARFSYFTVLLCIGTDVTARATVQISAVTGYQSYQLIWGAAPSHTGGNLSITSGLVNISDSSGTITLNFGKCASYWQFSSSSSNPTRGTTPDIHVLKVYGHSIRSNGYH